MSKHVVGTSPFLKRVLIPFWVFRIVFMVLEVAINGIAIGVVSAVIRYGNREGGYPASAATEATSPSYASSRS